MRADALPVNPRRIVMSQIKLPGMLPINSELVMVLAGRNVRMSAGPRRRDSLAVRREPGGAGVRPHREQFELGCRFDVKQQDTRAQSISNFLARLANTGKHDALAFDAGAGRSRSSSPPETMSKPLPSRARSRTTERLELAFTA